VEKRRGELSKKIFCTFCKDLKKIFVLCFLQKFNRSLAVLALLSTWQKQKKNYFFLVFFDHGFITHFSVFTGSKTRVLKTRDGPKYGNVRKTRMKNFHAQSFFFDRGRRLKEDVSTSWLRRLLHGKKKHHLNPQGS
jgi:hypothetical protein